MCGRSTELIVSAIRFIHASSGGSPAQHADVVVVEHRVAQGSNCIELDDGCLIGCLLEPRALGQAAGHDVADDRLDLDDVEPLAQHLAVGERAE